MKYIKASDVFVLANSIRAEYFQKGSELFFKRCPPCGVGGCRFCRRSPRGMAKRAGYGAVVVGGLSVSRPPAVGRVRLRCGALRPHPPLGYRLCRRPCLWCVSAVCPFGRWALLVGGRPHAAWRRCCGVQYGTLMPKCRLAAAVRAACVRVPCGGTGEQRKAVPPCGGTALITTTRLDIPLTMSITP